MDIATKVGALGALFACAGSALANPVIVADSVTGFSGVQGANGWSYGWYNLEDISLAEGTISTDTADFRAFEFYSAATGWWASDTDSAAGNPASGAVPGSYALVTQIYMHAHAPVAGAIGSLVGEEQWSVRRWTSDAAGLTTLSGFIALANYGSALGNGTEAHVLVDGVSVYSYNLEAGDFEGTEFSLELELEEGSLVEMVLGSKGDPYFDATEFTVQMSRVVPAPGSLALIGLGGLAAAKRRRR